jgi:hypothetical protein
MGIFMKIIKTIRAVTLTVAVVATIITPVIGAEDSVHFKAAINFEGTGCSTDSVTAEPEGSTLSVLFGKYDAANPPDGAVSGVRLSSCSFAVPVHVPAGWQISLLTADWRGGTIGEAELQREYFFAGQVDGIKIVSLFNDDDYTERDSLNPSTYTACQSEDQDIVLRVNSTALAISSDSYIGVESVDMDNKVVFKLNSQTCQSYGLPFIPLLLLQN